MQAEGLQTPMAVRVRVTGIVQGVGFRPFIYNLAGKLGLSGWVRNTSAGVEIEIGGSEESVDAFLAALTRDAPPLAHIESVDWEACAPEAPSSFRILPSSAAAGDFQPVAADVATCDDCLRELSDPNDRRYRYPFINCTHCGPRLTIIERMPYDRPNTTMIEFAMCSACAAEYRDPADRRFHAQPIACPECGPTIELIAGPQAASGEEALQAARLMIAEGQIVAIKGLGGFHLACDATSAEAVSKLRTRKGRGDKAFAVMFADVEVVHRHARLSGADRAALTGRERPIVVVDRRPESSLPTELAPGQKTIGAMLPYTPLHHLLLERAPGFPEALVMTSGNRSEEPIAIENSHARVTLDGIADAWLVHNRRIHQRCDDSVLRVVRGAGYPLRRSRGFVPGSLAVPSVRAPILGTGAELKNTFCLARDGTAFLGPHIGDLHNAETLSAFEEAIARFEVLFTVKPQTIACDLHPDYLATRYAVERSERDGLRLIHVQHHHAHIVACLADAGKPATMPVIGLALDGLGFGEDGALWGGEVLRVEGARTERLGHLAYVPQPGGDAATRQPWRMALAWLDHAGLPWEEDLPPVRPIAAETRAMIERVIRSDSRPGLQAPSTSSAGRLFDAMASLLGVRQEVRDEAQAAVELEAIVDPDERGEYPFEVRGTDFDAAPAFAAAVRDLRAQVPLPRMAARFHNGVAAALIDVVQNARRTTGLGLVALSGGVWQNLRLLELAVRGLERAGFDVLIHRRVPANDGGLALGQVVVASLTGG